MFRLQGNAICNVGEVAIAPESVPEQTFTPLEWGLLELCQVLPLPRPCMQAVSVCCEVRAAAMAMDASPHTAVVARTA